MNTKKSVTIIFIFFTAVTSSLIVYHSFDQRISTIYIERISIPSTILHIKKLPLESRQSLSREECKRFNTFRTYLDSLKSSLPGRLKYDSIIHVHPGLIDSLGFVEEIYFNNKK